MKLTFWGAAQTVTGSMHELEVAGRHYLLDCGLYQGRRQEANERNSRFPFSPSNIQAVLLSHAHIDHSGNLPGLVKNGFSGPIYTTSATADLCRAMLADSAHLQEQDAEFLNKRLRRRRALDPNAQGQTIQPLYTAEDAEKTEPLFRAVELGTPTDIGPGLRYQSYDAGHILGSTSMVLDLSDRPRPVRLAFSGDVGRPGLPIIRDPQPLPPVDYLILESTYGDRLHEAIAPVKNKLAGIITRTANRGGKIIVPAFAVGRTQQLVLLLHELINENRIPSIPMFVDSPLAVNVTEVFRNHPECFDEEVREFLNNHQDPFGFSRLRYVRDVNESKALNDLHGPFIVISASGMCEAGRILHHLRNNIGDSRNTVLLTGFQAQYTLGRKIQEKQAEVPIFGEPMPLRAEVETLDSLSGHADQHELLDWMKPTTPTLRKVFLVHGEEGQGKALAQAIHERYNIEVLQPARGQSIPLA
ncbi:MAG TPA: MBL fold metallo-hydrolase [Bryobacteraceae bacterium]|nr:MBL fold metallo-hydrolase [Bryobacteraceae bacterium]